MTATTSEPLNSVAALSAAIAASPGSGGSEAPPPQLVDVAKMPPDTGVARLIDHAVTMGASDLFFAANDQHMGVLVRHLGLVRPISVLPFDVGRKYLAHIEAN